MHTHLRCVLAMVLAALVTGCEVKSQPAQREKRALEVPPAPVATGEGVKWPAPPAVTGRASDCVVRSYHRVTKEWRVERWRYDAERRALQDGWLLFDALGRLVKRVDAESSLERRYDAAGNLEEETRWQDGRLAGGTRWSHRYEGDPPRLIATDVSSFMGRATRGRVHSRARYSYDSTGRIESMSEASGPTTTRYRYTWKDGRIAAEHGSMHSAKAMKLEGEVDYHVARTFEYDARGRIAKLTIDGMLPIGEGATANGAIDHVATFHYDASGHLERIEGDGSGGDVAPHEADGETDEITLLSPPCDRILALAPHLVGFPEVHLPNSVAPTFH